MSLKERLESKDSKNNTCQIYRAFANRRKEANSPLAVAEVQEDIEVFNAVLEAQTFSLRALTDALAEDGYDITYYPLTKHRRGDCACKGAAIPS